MRSNRVCLKERWMWKSPWRRRDCRETYCCSWNSRDTCWVGLSTPLALFLPSLQESLQRVIRLFMKIGSLFELIMSSKRFFFHQISCHNIPTVFTIISQRTSSEFSRETTRMTKAFSGGSHKNQRDGFFASKSVVLHCTVACPSPISTVISGKR